MILEQGQWKLMWAAQVEPGQINTAYLCDSRGHAERLAGEYAKGRGVDMPEVIQVYLRADVVSQPASPPSRMSEWLPTRHTKSRD